MCCSHLLCGDQQLTRFLCMQIKQLALIEWRLIFAKQLLVPRFLSRQTIFTFLLGMLAKNAQKDTIKQKKRGNANEWRWRKLRKISPKNTPTATTWWVVFCGLGLYGWDMSTPGALLNSGAQSDSGPRILHKSLGSVHGFTDLWCMKSLMQIFNENGRFIHSCYFSLRNPNLAQHMEDSVEKIFGVASAHGVVWQLLRPYTWQLATQTMLQTTSFLDPQRAKQIVIPKQKRK